MKGLRRHVNTSPILHLKSWNKWEIGDLLFIAAYTYSSWLAQAFVAYRYSDSLISMYIYIYIYVHIYVCVENLFFTHCFFEWLDSHVKRNTSLQWTTLLLDRLGQHMFAFTHNIQEQILENHQEHSLREQIQGRVRCTVIWKVSICYTSKQEEQDIFHATGPRSQRMK